MRDSGIHGRGAFATRALAPGETIGTYQGRRYRGDEPARDWDTGLTYVFGLSDGSWIDGGEGGNATRHLNHSCEPNCIACEVEGADGELHIVIEAARPIAAGEELFIDYALDVPDPADDAYACRCGAPGCRGTMLGQRADSASTA